MFSEVHLDIETDGPGVNEDISEKQTEIPDFISRAKKETNLYDYSPTLSINKDLDSLM